MSSSSPIRFDVVALDTPDPAALARFYCDLLGWRVESADDDWVTIRSDQGTGPGGVGRLAFQLAPDFVAPTWPDPAVPQQVHLDLAVADLDEGEAFATSVGARRVEDSKAVEDFRVFLDPAGHPFCLCLHVDARSSAGAGVADPGADGAAADGGGAFGGC